MIIQYMHVAQAGNRRVMKGRKNLPNRLESSCLQRGGIGDNAWRVVTEGGKG
jgi:hypothetical protein